MLNNKFQQDLFDDLTKISCKVKGTLYENQPEEIQEIMLYLATQYFTPGKYYGKLVLEEKKNGNT